MNAIYEFHLANKTTTGCGTLAEFNHWNAMGVFGEGAYLGKVIGQEPAALDVDRTKQWAA